MRKASKYLFTGVVLNCLSNGYVAAVQIVMVMVIVSFREYAAGHWRMWWFSMWTPTPWRAPLMTSTTSPATWWDTTITTQHTAYCTVTHFLMLSLNKSSGYNPQSNNQQKQKHCWYEFDVHYVRVYFENPLYAYYFFLFFLWPIWKIYHRYIKTVAAITFLYKKVNIAAFTVIGKVIKRKWLFL